jgi:hypothetical protein
MIETASVNTASSKTVWEHHARKISRQVNIGWWLQTLAGPLVFFSLVGTCALLLIRRENPNLPLWQCSLAVSGLIAIVAGGAWLLAKKFFEKPAQSFVRIEAAMHLRSGLSAALAGVAPWPQAPAKPHAGLTWNWSRVLLAPLAALLMLLAGLFVPVSAILPNKPAPDEPQAWARTESELQNLEKDAVVDQPYIEEVRKKIEDLRAQDPEEWFGHSSMEATDNMRKEHKSEAKRLERDMSQAAKAFGALEKNPATSDQEKQRIANEFEQALDGMKNGGMKPNPALLEQLKSLDPAKLSQLTPEQLKQMKENLEKALDKLDGQGEGEGEDWADELNADGSHPGDNEGQGQGGEGEGEGEGEGPGKGGASRGPGHDPNLLGKASQDLKTGNMEALKTEDLSKARPGDLLELQDGEHDVDKSATGISGGGDIKGTGKGGDRVWKESLDPQEQKALKKFFE